MTATKKPKSSKSKKTSKSRTRAKKVKSKTSPVRPKKSSPKKSKTKRKSPVAVKNRPSIFDPAAFEKYLNITDSIVLSIDFDQKVTLINKAACKLLGYNENEILGKNWFDNFIPDSIEKRMRTLFTRFCTGKIDLTGYREGLVLTRQGEEHVIEWETMALEDGNGKRTGALSFGRDITDRNKLEKALSQSEWDLSMAQKIAGLGSMVYEVKTNKLRWTEETYKIFGLSRREFNGTYEAFLQTVHPDDRAKTYQTCQQSLYEKKPYSIDHRIVLPDGKVRFVHAEAKVFYDDRGNPLQSKCVIQDITERKEVEEELKKSQEQLIHSEKLSSIGKLSASIAHEVNNPLFGIRNVLERTKLVVSMKEEDMNFIDMAISETDRIADLIKRLNDFYRPTSDKRKPLEINQVLSEIILLTQKELLKRNIQLKTQFSENLPTVIAVSDQIKQVMLNLIQNAMDTLPNTGGQIDINTTYSGSLVKIQIQDNGIGMTAEIIKEIFNPFFTTKSKVVGTGLGLYVSYGIIQSHGGTIEVVSTPGKGSSFTVLLPVMKI